LKNIVVELTKSPDIGQFASRVASGEQFSGPKAGQKDDKAHPPIHPVKHLDKNSVHSDEWRVYDLLSRHFLASLAKDAKGSETKVKVDYGEAFHIDGEECLEMNWLEIFPWIKWSDKDIPCFFEG